MTEKGEGKMHEGNLIEGLDALVQKISQAAAEGVLEGKIDRHIAEELTHKCAFEVEDYRGKVFPCGLKAEVHCTDCGKETCTGHTGPICNCGDTLCIACVQFHECGGAL